MSEVTAKYAALINVEIDYITYKLQSATGNERTELILSRGKLVKSLNDLEKIKK